MGEDTTTMPPGFHFFPSDEELVVHFLYRKAAHLPCQPDIIPTIDIHDFDPWDLDGKAHQGDNQWYFFTQPTQNRASSNGYWTPVGVDVPITSGGNEVGMKRTLVYYIGEDPYGIKTNWVMHEYHLSDGVNGTSTSSSSSSGRRSCKKRANVNLRAWVICRVYETNFGGYHDDGTELSCLDEVFMSLDDLDEVSRPNY